MRPSFWPIAAVAFTLLGQGQTNANIESLITGQNLTEAVLQRTKRAPTLPVTDDLFLYGSLTQVAPGNTTGDNDKGIPVPVLGYRFFARNLDARSPGSEPLEIIHFDPSLGHKGLSKREVGQGVQACFKARGGQSVAEWGNSAVGFHDAKGEDISEKKKEGLACSQFPLVPDKIYNLASWDLHDVADLIKIGGCVNPFWNMLGTIFEVFATLADQGWLNTPGNPLLQTLCILRSGDTNDFIGLSFMPSFFPGLDKILEKVAPPWTITPTLRGFAGDASGNIQYGSASPITVWNGQFAVKFEPVIDFWAGIDIDFSVGTSVNVPGTGKKAKISVTVGADVFGGFSTASNTVFLHISKIELGLFGFIPPISVARGFAGWVVNERTAEGNKAEICNPSGIFTSIELKPEAPEPLVKLEGVGKKFFEFGTGARADLSILFRGKEFNGFAFRVYLEVEFLSIQLGKIQAEVQFIGFRELERRKAFLYKPAGCCTDYHEKTGICLDYGRPTGIEATAPSGLRPVDIWLYHQPMGNYILLYLGARTNLGFIGGIVKLTDLVIIAAFQDGGINAADGDNPYFIYVEASISVMMIAGLDTTVTLTDSYAGFSVSAILIGVNTTVSGESGPPPGQLDAPNGKSVKDTEFDLDVDVDWGVLGEVAKAIAEAVGVVIKAVADFAVKVWNEVRDQISKIANGIKEFFLPSGPLGNFGVLLGDVGAAFASVIGGVANAVGSVLNQIGKSWTNIADAASKFADGDVIGGFVSIGQAIGIGYTSENLRLADTGKVHENGCKILIQEWDECFEFLFLDITCSVKRGAETLDEKCVKEKTLAVQKVQTMQVELDRKINAVADSIAHNQGLVYMANGGQIPADQIHLGQNKLFQGTSKPATSGLQRRNAAAVTVDVPIDVPELDTLTPGFKPRVNSKTYPATFNDLYSPSTYESDLRTNIDGFIVRATADIQGGNKLGPEILRETSARIPPVLTAPSARTFKCSIDIYARTDLLGKPTVNVDPNCEPATRKFGLSLVQDASGGVCGGTLVTATWTFTDACGQSAPSVLQYITIEPEPPRWIPSEQDPSVPVVNKKVSCESDVSPQTTGKPAAKGGCVGNAGGISVTYTDDAPVLISCGVWEIKRNWKAVATGCPNDPNQTIFYVQSITVEDKVAPYWKLSAFPADTTVDFLAPYGTGTLGYPTAHDSCGNAPVTITYADTVVTNNVQCAAEKVVRRTWTAKDTCGNTATRDQKITFTNTKRYFGDATLMQLYGGTSSQVSNGKIPGQIAGASVLVASSNTIGHGTCAFTSNSLIIESTGVLSSNKVYNGKQITSATTWGFAAAKTSMKTFSTLLNEQNTAKRVGLHNGATVIQCPSGILATRQSAAGLFLHPAFVFGVPNYINHGTCTVTSTITATQISPTTTATSYVLTGTDLVYNIFTLPQAVLARAVGIQITVPPTSISIINVVGAAATSIVINSITLSGADPRTVLWNFPDTTYIANGKPTFVWSGSILAPSAYFVSGAMMIKGQLLSGGGVSLNSVNFECNHFAAFRFCKDVESTAVKI